MPNYKQYNDWIGFAEESVYGTYTTPTLFVFVDTISPPTINREIIDYKLIRGNASPHVDDVNKGFESTSFNISFPVPIIATGSSPLVLLKHAFGKVTKTGTSSPYTHLFEPDGEQPAIGLSFSIGIGGVKRYKISGCRIESMKLSANVNSTMKCEMAIKGKKVAIDQTQNTPSYTLLSTRPKFWESCNVDSKIEFPAGASLNNGVSWEVNLKNTLLSSPSQAGALGNDTFVQLPKYDITGTIKLDRRADETDGAGGSQSILNQYAESLNPTPLRILYEYGSIGSEKYTFKIDANVVIPKPVSYSYDGGILKETAECECRWDSSHEIMSITTISGCDTPNTGS